GAIALLAAAARAETLNVHLVLSGNNPPYQQFSVALDKALAASKANVAVSGPQFINSINTDLVVAVGMKAVESAIANSNAPVLGVMIPRAGYEALLEKRPLQQRPVAASAIYIDQPWDRQLDFIQATLPGRRKIGLLYSPDTHLDFAGLRQNIAGRGLSLAAQPVRSAETLFATLDDVLGASDLLLAVPDSAIYSSGNVRNILLTSYRHKTPMIGISQAYVNAGALCAIFSTPEQLAVQTGEAIASFAKNRRLPEPQYPESFSIGLNEQVAHSLGIALDSPETIRRRMDKTGEGRR
ncbi:MAG: hypothetical protein EPN14_10125, partial [Gallionella sp.]